MRKTEGRHRDSNPEPSDHVPSTLTIAPPKHDRCGRLDSAPKYSVTLAARMRPPPSAFLPPPRVRWLYSSRPVRGVGRAYALVVPTCVSRAGLRQNHEWLVGGA